jgi:hypothetical protein
MPDDEKEPVSAVVVPEPVAPQNPVTSRVVLEVHRNGDVDVHTDPPRTNLDVLGLLTRLVFRFCEH